MKYDDNDNAQNGIHRLIRAWIITRCTTATVTMIISMLRHNNQDMVTKKYKRGEYKSDRATSAVHLE